MTGLKNIFVLVIFINAIIVCLCENTNVKSNKNSQSTPVSNYKGGDITTSFSGKYVYSDENGIHTVEYPETTKTEAIQKRAIYEDHPLVRLKRHYAILDHPLFRKSRQIPGIPGGMPGGGLGGGIGDLTGINQMVRFKPYKFTGRRRMNPELLFPGAVIGDGVSQPIGSFAGIGYLGESDLVGLAPSIYDRLPMPNLFQSSYPGLMPGMIPNAEAQAAAAGLSDPEDLDSESLPLGPVGNDLDLESDLDRR